MILSLRERVIMQIDIHSHRLYVKTGQIQFLALDPLCPSDFKNLSDLYQRGISLSVGVHPWKTINWAMVHKDELQQILSDPRISMIGEIGLDKVCPVPFREQQQAYEAQLEMADLLRKPVLLHVVHTMAEIIKSPKIHLNVPAWIIHGFRGGRQEAQQYIAKGFYISFGMNYKPESLTACPLDRIFLETDDSGGNVNDLYIQVATLLKCPVEQLENQIEMNFRSIFPTLL